MFSKQPLWYKFSNIVHKKSIVTDTFLSMIVKHWQGSSQNSFFGRFLQSHKCLINNPYDTDFLMKSSQYGLLVIYSQDPHPQDSGSWILKIQRCVIFKDLRILNPENFNSFQSLKFSGFRILKSLKITHLWIFRTQDPES